MNTGPITCKFGGTSLADADRIRASAAIVEADPDRRFVIPSAPGKRGENDKKITDLLLGWFHAIRSDLDPSQPIAQIGERFAEVVKDLGVEVDIHRELDAIQKKAAQEEREDFLASRGEYLNGLILAEVLGAKFVDAAECIRFDFEGNIDEATYALVERALDGDGRYVVPGFYGTDPEGRIRTMTRGGSDVTGSIVARATRSRVYENWTDVSGIRMTDPRIVPEARKIAEITYGELRELAYMGATVLHDEAVFPLYDVGIPIHIRNSDAPEEEGTLIVADRRPTQPVCGIAARDGFTMINIEKTMMNREVGFARRALSVLEEHHVSFEHMPTGIDTISLIIKNEELDRHGESILEGIDRVCTPDKISISGDLALIATVGLGMNHHVGVAAHLCGALSSADVNVRVLDQGSSEMNIIVGVDRADLEKAVRAIYHAFEAWT